MVARLTFGRCWLAGRIDFWHALPGLGRGWFGMAQETTQGQMDGFFSQLLYKFYLEEVATVGDWRMICPPHNSRVAVFVAVSLPQVDCSGLSLGNLICEHS